MKIYDTLNSFYKKVTSYFSNQSKLESEVDNDNKFEAKMVKIRQEANFSHNQRMSNSSPRYTF